MSQRAPRTLLPLREKEGPGRVGVGRMRGLAGGAVVVWRALSVEMVREGGE